MSGHAQLKFVMTECSKTQIRLTGLIYICTVLYVSVIMLCVMELLQTTFCIFEYSREATILQVESFQKQILSLQKTVGNLN